jgi:hypothetical protein
MKEVIEVIEMYLKTGEINLDLLIKIFIFWLIFIIIVSLFKVIHGKIVSETNLKNYKLNVLKESKKVL